MLTGDYPFTGDDFKVVFHKITKAPIDKGMMVGLSEEAVDIILDMLARNPIKRKSVRDLIKHPWFENKLEKQINQTRKMLTKDFFNHLINAHKLSPLIFFMMKVIFVFYSKPKDLNY